MPRSASVCLMVRIDAVTSSTRLFCSGLPSTLHSRTKLETLPHSSYTYSHRWLGSSVEVARSSASWLGLGLGLEFRFGLGLG